MRFQRLPIPLTLIVAVVASQTASAQIAVHDPAVTWRNQITAVQKELQLATQRAQHAQLVEMARRLTALTSLDPYALREPPLWRVHGEEARYAADYTRALTFGDAAGQGYAAVTHPLGTLEGTGLPLRPEARRALTTRLSTVEVADAAAITATHDTGRLRFAGRTERQAVDALATDVVDPSDEQSATAVLDKVSGAVLIGARQRQARLQLVTGLVEQLLVDSKRARDTEALSLNMQVTSWRQAAQANAAFHSGTGHALHTWRQP